MSDKDSLFDFLDGLKDWARVELERRGVQNLDEAHSRVPHGLHVPVQGEEAQPWQRWGREEDKTKKDHGRKEGGARKPSWGDKRDKPSGGKSEAPKPRIGVLASFVTDHIGYATAQSARPSMP